MPILCFGDSNTYGYDPRSYFGSRYPAEDRWTEILRHSTGWEVVNCGENGREIPQSPDELARAEQLLTRQEAGVTVVMLGTNDLLQGASVSLTVTRMEAFLRQIQNKCKRILLVAPPPMQPGTWTSPQLQEASAQLAREYEALADTLGIGFADAGEWNIAITFDGVHFSEEGHRAFAKGIQAKLERWK